MTPTAGYIDSQATSSVRGCETGASHCCYKFKALPGYLLNDMEKTKRSFQRMPRGLTMSHPEGPRRDHWRAEREQCGAILLPATGLVPHSNCREDG